MALTARQTAAYQHLFNLWAPATRTFTASVPSAESYSLSASAVPGIYEQKPHISDQFGAGRAETRMLESSDRVHVASDVTIGDGWVIKNVTLLSDGSQSPEYGAFYRVIGSPHRQPSNARRTPNKQSVMVIDEPHPPTGVS